MPEFPAPLKGAPSERQFSLKDGKTCTEYSDAHVLFLLVKMIPGVPTEVWIIKVWPHQLLGSAPRLVSGFCEERRQRGRAPRPCWMPRFQPGTTDTLLLSLPFITFFRLSVCNSYYASLVPGYQDGHHYFQGHEGPHVECTEHGVVEKALDREWKGLYFRPGSASVVWGNSFVS